MRKFLFHLFLFALSVSPSFASFDFNGRIQNAYAKIISLHFEEGKKILDEESKLNPSNNLTSLYYNYIDFLTAFISEEKKYLDTLLSGSERRLKKLEDDKSDSPFLLFSKSEIILQTAIVKVKFRENISAALDIRKSYKLIEQNDILYPSFLLNKKTFGFLHTLVGAVPHEYRWIVSFAGMDGTIPQGTDELNGLFNSISENNYEIYRTEILFLLTNIYTSFSKNETYTTGLLNQLKPFCRSSALMKYCYSNVAMRAGKNDEVLQVLSTYQPDNDEFSIEFLKYKNGLAKLRKLDFTCVDDFVEFNNNFHGLNYFKSSFQKIAWVALINGDKKKYHQCLDSCINKGSNFVDEDKDALMEAESGEIPDVTLLKARLLFDGGYYQKALNEMLSKPVAEFSRFRDQLEVTYRFARIFHKLNETEKAIEYYQRTIDNGSSSKFYFAANSALLLGNIYEEQKKISQAKTYYEQCLALRHHDYQNSIDQKAQAGLERIDDKKGIIDKNSW